MSFAEGSKFLAHKTKGGAYETLIECQKSMIYHGSVYKAKPTDWNRRKADVARAAYMEQLEIYQSLTNESVRD